MLWIFHFYISNAFRSQNGTCKCVFRTDLMWCIVRHVNIPLANPPTSKPQTSVYAVFSLPSFVSKYKKLTRVKLTDLMGAWGCSRALWPSRAGEGVGGGKRARGLRVCPGGPLYRPDAASAFLRRSPPPRQPRPRLGQRCPGAPRSNLHTAAPPGLFHAGAVGGGDGYGEGVVV